MTTIDETRSLRERLEMTGEVLGDLRHDHDYPGFGWHPSGSVKQLGTFFEYRDTPTKACQMYVNVDTDAYAVGIAIPGGVTQMDLDGFANFIEQISAFLVDHYTDDTLETEDEEDVPAVGETRSCCQ